MFCSGANLELLDQDECKTERGRYAMIGAFVALTAVFASLSGGYALHSGFKTLPISILAGILWGTFIFTLDRYIVSTIRKQHTAADAGSRAKIINKLSEVVTALPRIGLAVMIATTVAVPLELKYFDPEIRTQLAKNDLEAGTAVATTAQQGLPEIAALERELGVMDEQENRLRERRDLLRDQRFNEVNGAKGEGYTGIPGYGPEARRREAEAKDVEDELKTISTANADRRQTARTRLDNLRTQLGNTLQQQGDIRRAGDGFLARIKALNQLAEADELVKGATRFVVLLLILIETAPVLIKLFATRGPYDDLLEVIEHKVYITKQKEISNFNTDIMKDLALYDAISDARHSLEEQLTLESMRLDRIQNHAAAEVEDANAEIARARIEHWRWQELQRLAKAH